MFRALLSASLGQDYLYFGLRWLVLIGGAFATLLSRGELASLTLERFSERYEDILIVLVVNAVITVLLGVTISISATRPYAPFLILLGDWSIVGTFSVVAGTTPVILVGVVGVTLVGSLLRLGTAWGVPNALTSIAVSLVVLIVRNVINFNLPPLILLAQHAPPFLLISLFGVVAWGWSNALDEDKTLKSRKLRERVQENNRRLENMRQRAKALSEMATVLNSTLDYNKIINASMDIGRFALFDNAKQRLISIALLVGHDEQLEMTASRGLQHIDENKLFRGKSGILAQTLSESRVIIVSQGGDADPELGSLTAFTNIEAVMCVPLRASYNTYGVLVFGSTSKNAFNEDHIDTMQALGLQVTIALQNAVLYSTLSEEKERIIRIEENARKALVRDLHDIPTQTISAVAMQLGTIPLIAERRPETLREEVELIRNMALRAVEEIRHVMFALRPLSLESQGLAVALEQLAQKMQQTYKQAMQVQVDPNAEYHLKQEQQGTLFYLIEEASNNARKYAQADLIRVQVVMQGSNVIARISDNGKGFNVAEVGKNYEQRSSFGMVNMRERAELVGGVLDLQSQIGKGTVVTVTVPVETKDAPLPPPTQSRRKGTTRPHTGPLSPST